MKKLETPFYHLIQNVSQCLEASRSSSRVWQTDRQTTAVSNSAV